MANYTFRSEWRLDASPADVYAVLHELGEANMVGDLTGFSRWTITADGAGTLAVFDEEVDATKASLQKLEPVARPAFKANHWLMMRHGQAGLRTYVAGYRLGRRG